MFSTDPQYQIKYGTTTLNSETLLDSFIDLHTREQLVAFNNPQHVNGYDEVIKNVDSFTNDVSKLPYFYNDIYIKPGLGIVQINIYQSKNSFSGGTPFQMITQMKLGLIY